MPVLVTTGPLWSFSFRRTRRRLQALVGGVLVTIAAVTAPVVVLTPAFLLTTLGSSSEIEQVSPEAWRAVREGWSLAALMTITGVAYGWYLLRGSRGMVLWLRRFRYGEAVAFLSAALAHIGPSWRVVTLDDAMTPPVGVAPGLRLWSRFHRDAGRTFPLFVKRTVTAGKIIGVAAIAGFVVPLGLAS